MKVSYFLRDDGGCGFYRLEQPLKALAHYTDTHVMKTERGDPVGKIIEAAETDIFVVPRPCEENWPLVFMAARQKGCRIVVDHDDDMFSVSPMSPHYKDFGVEDVEVVVNGKVVPVWIDGKNYSREDNQKKLDGFKRSLESANMVTVTTDHLANVYREYNDNVVVLPNCVDPNMWKKLPLIKEQDILKLHWGGGSSHTEDIMMVEDAICTVLEKYPHVHLSIAGVKWEWSFKSVPEDRITYTGWTPTPAYPYVSAIQNPDIGFIPLIDNPFNRCKSNLKWIEMGSMGVPCVMSNVTPYKEAYDGKNAIMVDNTHKAWVKGLEVLINDPDLRAKIGQAAQDTVLRDFDIHKKYVLWEQAYKELINGR